MANPIFQRIYTVEIKKTTKLAYNPDPEVDLASLNILADSLEEALTKTEDFLKAEKENSFSSSFYEVVAVSFNCEVFCGLEQEVEEIELTPDEPYQEEHSI